MKKLMYALVAAGVLTGGFFYYKPFTKVEAVKVEKKEAPKPVKVKKHKN